MAPPWQRFDRWQCYDMKSHGRWPMASAGVRDSFSIHGISCYRRRPCVRLPARCFVYLTAGTRFMYCNFEPDALLLYLCFKQVVGSRNYGRALCAGLSDNLSLLILIVGCCCGSPYGPRRLHKCPNGCNYLARSFLQWFIRPGMPVYSFEMN